MTSDHFCSLALTLPDTEEAAHMGHPDFRVRGKIFASLDSPKPGFGMVKLAPKDQATFLKSHPDIFTPATGAWGAAGATHIQLGRGGVDKATLTAALQAAWRNVAPKTLVKAFEDGE